ncbi:hypothetical protein [Runella rosea]|nr:hypothetical protein [Runella rosea]
MKSPETDSLHSNLTVFTIGASEPEQDITTEQLMENNSHRR